MPFLNRYSLLAFCSLIALNIALVLLVFVGEMDIYVENSWMENLQVLFLYFSCAAFAFQSKGLNPKHKVLCYLFSLLCFIFAFRELDVDKFDVPEWLIWLLAEKGRGIFIAAWLLLLAIAAKDIKYYWQHKLRYLVTPSIVYLLIAFFTLMIFSHAFDRKWVKVGEYQAFYEELSEISAYYCLVIFALFSRSDFRKIEADINE